MRRWWARLFRERRRPWEDRAAASVASGLGWRLLRCLLPSGFRSRRAEEILAVHVALAGGAARARGARFWARLSWDVAATAVRLRLEAGRARRRARGGGGVRSGRRSRGRGGFAGALRPSWRHVLRLYGRRPLYGGFVTVTLALGIGAATATYSVLDGVLLRPLPYPAADRLMTVWQTFPHFRSDPNLMDRWDRIGLSWDDYEVVRNGVRSVEAIAVYASESAIVARAGEEPRQVNVARASASLLPMLGVRPALGRWLTAEEEGAGAPRVVVLSFEEWAREWNADANVLGGTIRIGGSPFEVVGVLPRGFGLPTLNPGSPAEAAALWTPIGTDDDHFTAYSQVYDAIGRLRPGVAPDVLVAEVDALLRSERTAERYGVRVQARLEAETGAARPRLFLLGAAVALLMLLTCANVAALLIGETAARSGELATRTALGATPGRLVAQLLGESVALAVAAGTIGVALAFVGTDMLLDLAPVTLPRSDGIGVDWRVLLFALVTAFATALLIGLAPALAARGAAGAARTVGRATQSARLQHTLITVQVAITVVLLAAATLLVRTLAVQVRFESGFRTDGMLGLRVRASSGTNEEMRTQLAEQLRRIAALPGVTGATAVTALPFREPGNTWATGLDPEAPLSATSATVTRITVWPNFAETLGLRVLEGRGLRAEDNAADARTLVVNAAFVRRFWPDDAVVGRALRTPLGAFTIVGVVSDARMEAPDVAPTPTYYIPYGPSASSRLTFLVATAGADALASADDVRRAIRAVDPGLAVIETTTLAALVHESLADERYRATLLLAFSLVGTLLAAVGIAGTTLRVYERRRRELAVRMCVGATPRAAGARLVRGAVLAVAVGLLAGLLAVFPAGRVLRSQIAAVGATDATVLAPASIVVLAAALLALVAPLRRLRATDLARTLREL
jgi:putative ABC transport system permease protein